MKLRTLRIGRLPGIAVGYTLDRLGPGINLVHGPNASGKSSICRAFRALCYPGEAVGGLPDLGGLLELSDGRQLGVTRLGSEIRWEHDGRPAESPALPEHRHAGCFTIAIDDLVAAGGNESVLAAAIARELNGGFDLRAVSAEPPFRCKPRHGRKEARELRLAEAALARVRREHEALHQEAGQLDGLLAEQAQAESARGAAQCLELALTLQRQRAEHDRCERALGAFPAQMSRLHGDEAARMEVLERRIAALEEDRRRALGDGQEATRRQREASGAGVLPDDAALETARRRLRDARAAQAELRALEARLAESASRRARARAGLAGGRPGTDSERDLAITPERVAMAERGLARRRELEARHVQLLASLEALNDALGASPEPALGADALRRARGALLDWLSVAAPGAGERGRVGGGWLAALPIALAAGGAVLLAAARSGSDLLLLLIPLGVGIGHGLTRHLAARRLAERARRVYLGSGAPAPAAWRRGAVEAALATQDEALRRAEAAAERHRRCHELARQQQVVEGALAVNGAELAALARRVGFDPSRLDASFNRWLRLTQALDDAEQEHDRLTARKQSAQAALAADAALLGELLSPGRARPGWAENENGGSGLMPIAALDAAEAELTRLERRRRDRAEADLALRAAQAASSSAAAGLSAARAEHAALLAEAGVPAERDAALGLARAQLLQRLEQLPAWRAASDALAAASAAQAHTAAQLEQAEAAAVWPGADEARRALGAGDEAALAERLEQARALAQRAQGLAQRVADIRARVELLSGGHTLADARGACRDAESGLEGSYREALFAEAGAFLLEGVERDHDRGVRPRVLRVAEDLFGRFTGHRFRLAFQDRPAPSFRAVDVEQEALLEVAELSVGTRMQMLLALRLAFAQEVERGREALPIFVDEALATADPERFAAVAQSLGVLARTQDRQIFYLTAQPQEARQWEQLGIAVHAIDIGTLRRGEQTVPAWTRAAPSPAPVPAPCGDPRKYAQRLEVPGIDPWQPGGAVHLLHLLPDALPVLHRLLLLGVRSAGQLRSMLDAGGAAAAAGAESSPELAARLQLLEAYLEAWRRGRQPPLAPLALREAPLPERFRAPLSDLAELSGGDAAGVLEALDKGGVRGLGPKKVEQLRLWLAEEGYLDDRPVLDEAGRLYRVLAASDGWSHADALTAEQIRGLVGWLDQAVAPPERGRCLRPPGREIRPEPATTPRERSTR